jgi:hypothetical protein
MVKREDLHKELDQLLIKSVEINNRIKAISPKVSSRKLETWILDIDTLNEYDSLEKELIANSQRQRELIEELRKLPKST